MSPVVLSCATRFSATSCRVQCNVTTDDSRLDDSCGALAAVLGLKILAGFVRESNVLLSTIFADFAVNGAVIQSSNQLFFHDPSVV